MTKCRGMKFRDDDDAYEYFRQREVDDEAEAREIEAKRNASGSSPEILSLQDAYLEGQRLGMAGFGPEMNTYAPGTPEWHECDRGRRNALGFRLGGKIAA